MRKIYAQYLVLLVLISGCGAPREVTPVPNSTGAENDVSAAAFPEVARALNSLADRHGAHALLEEYYNLIGNRPTVRTNERNRELIAALGINDNGLDEISKTNLLQVMSRRERRDLRLLVRRTLQMKSASLGIDDSSLLMLNWALGSATDFQTNYRASDSDVIVGWDKLKVIGKPGDWTLHTFGLVDCTAIVALSPEGPVFFSHDSQLPFTQGFIDVLEMFLTLHRDSSVFVIGTHASDVAGVLKPKLGLERLAVHQKQAGRKNLYHLRVSRRGDETSIEHQNLPISDDFIESLYPEFDSGELFAFGRLSEMLPGMGATYAPLDFDFIESDLAP